jgi:hypothetical protein
LVVRKNEPVKPDRGQEPSAGDDANAKVFRPQRILEILAKREVEFILIGGVATALHGAPFPTVDVDIVPALETSNLDRLAAALNDLDALLRDSAQPAGIRLDLDGRTLKKAIPGFGFLRFDTKFGYLDIIYKPAGIQGFGELARSATEEDTGSARIRVASLEDVIRSKQAVGRPRDLEQLPTLRRLLELVEESNKDSAS